MKPAIVFDLDGTLVDSIGDLAAATNRMLGNVDHAPLPLEVIKRFVGNGLPKLVERVINHCDLPMDRHAELSKMTLTHYNAASSATSRPYPGIPEALVQLRDMGCALGVCTNKPESAALHLLKALGLDQYFVAVLGGDSLPVRKPDPAHLHASFDALSAAGPRLFVGDSEVDAETAARAEVPFLLFTEGYRKSPVAEIHHDIAYSTAAELPSAVTELLTSQS